jgi:hypothetical protein
MDHGSQTEKTYGMDLRQKDRDCTGPQIEDIWALDKKEGGTRPPQMEDLWASVERQW